MQDKLKLIGYLYSTSTGILLPWINKISTKNIARGLHKTLRCIIPSVKISRTTFSTWYTTTIEDVTNKGQKTTKKSVLVGRRPCLLSPSSTASRFKLEQHTASRTAPITDCIDPSRTAGERLVRTQTLNKNTSTTQIWRPRIGVAVRSFGCTKLR